MTWVLWAAVLVPVFVVFPLARRRRRVFTASSSGPVPTMSMSKRHDKKKRAALDSATSVLQ
jgi:hypothetical protein